MANAIADHSLRDLVKSLRHESGASQDFHSALDTASKLVRNVLEQPDEPKFRSIRLSNSAFQQRLGRFASGISLLRALGFEDAHGDGESAGPPSHLALPIADPVLLANGLVYLTAAREASDVLIGEQAGRSAPPTTTPSVTSAATVKPPPRRVEAVRSNASGKRPAAASSASPQSQDGGGSVLIPRLLAVLRTAAAMRAAAEMAAAESAAMETAAAETAAVARSLRSALRSSSSLTVRRRSTPTS